MNELCHLPGFRHDAKLIEETGKFYCYETFNVHTPLFGSVPSKCFNPICSVFIAVVYFTKLELISVPRAILLTANVSLRPTYPISFSSLDDSAFAGVLQNIVVKIVIFRLSSHLNFQF